MEIKTNPKIDFLRNKALTLVEQPGVYLMKNKDGAIIYIGKAKRLKHRVVSYFRVNKSHNDKVRKMVSLVNDFDYIVTDSEFEALVLECSLIKQYSPKYNILLKDDKGYHYIQITDEPYPRIKAVMQKPKDKSILLGPYTSSFSVKESVEQVNQVFSLPTCNKRFPEDFRKTRPCLNFHIKKCMGVCTGKISQSVYKSTISEATDYLKKGSSQSIAYLTEKMLECSENLEFEKAVKYRDKISAIKRLSENQKVLLVSDKNQDFIGIEKSGLTSCIVILKFREGLLNDKDSFIFNDIYDVNELIDEFIPRYYQNKDNIPKTISLSEPIENLSLYEQYLSEMANKKITINVPQKGDGKKIVLMAQNNALEFLSQKLSRNSSDITALNELAKLLGLSTIPEYIESYDVSNWKDDSIVCGMVVFEHGKPLKSAYKKFAMKEHATQDDYGCMGEAITRRFTRYLSQDEDDGFSRLPDLILLDGGLGHVNVITPILKQMGINVPVFGMVKDQKHRTRAIASNGGEIQISTFKSAFRLITNIQDEVHRFSIKFHRAKQKKNSLTSSLTTIRGIGEKKALLLLKHYKTKKAISQASIEDISKVAKVNVDIAKEIKDSVLN